MKPRYAAERSCSSDAHHLARTHPINARVPLRHLFEFLVLTVLRSGEAREARWTEVDFDKAIWSIPGSRMKRGIQIRLHGPQTLPFQHSQVDPILDPAISIH